MTTARQTFENSISTVSKTSVSVSANGGTVAIDAQTAVNKAVMDAQTSINAVGVDAGANPQLGASDSQIAAVKAANLAKFKALSDVERAKQSARDAAREALRAAGDFGPT